MRTHISPDTVVWVCRERLSSRANEATIGDGGRSIVMPLYDFERDNQLQLIASHLQHYGRLTGPRKEGAFGEIFTFERDGYPRHIVAKCPKIEKFGSDARAREALGKTVIELEKTLSYYRHPGVHRISGLELVHGWPFLEAISESMRNVCREGLDGRARCDSGQVFEALPETSCGRRPPAGSIAARGYVMEVT